MTVASISSLRPNLAVGFEPVWAGSTNAITKLFAVEFVFCIIVNTVIRVRRVLYKPSVIDIMAAEKRVAGATKPKKMLQKKTIFWKYCFGEIGWRFFWILFFENLYNVAVGKLVGEPDFLPRKFCGFAPNKGIFEE